MGEIRLAGCICHSCTVLASDSVSDVSKLEMVKRRCWEAQGCPRQGNVLKASRS